MSGFNGRSRSRWNQSIVAENDTGEQAGRFAYRPALGRDRRFGFAVEAAGAVAGAVAEAGETAGVLRGRPPLAPLARTAAALAALVRLPRADIARRIKSSSFIFPILTCPLGYFQIAAIAEHEIGWIFPAKIHGIRLGDFHFNAGRFNHRLAPRAGLDPENPILKARNIKCPLTITEATILIQTAHLFLLLKMPRSYLAAFGGASWRRDYKSVQEARKDSIAPAVAST
jgi:hypothetical protein